MPPTRRVSTSQGLPAQARGDRASHVDADDGGHSNEIQASNRPTVLVLSKAIALLEALAEADSGLHLAELARRLNMNRSTVYRILSTLEAHRLVMRNEQLAYRLGFGLFELGSRVKAQDVAFHAAAMKYLRATADSLQMTTFLFVRDGDRAICVERVEMGEVFIALNQVGTSPPLTAGAGPRALLAFCADGEIERILQVAPVKLTPKTMADPAQIWEEIRAIRATGISFSDQDVALGLSAIAAPVFGSRGDVVAAVSISGLCQLFVGSERERLAEAVRQLASDITRELSGFHPAWPASRGAAQTPFYGNRRSM